MAPAGTVPPNLILAAMRRHSAHASLHILRPTRLAVAVSLLMPAIAALAQSAPSAPPAADKPVSREDAPKKETVQTVEVKGAAASYDPRRDDTASKTVLNADEIRKYGDDNIFDVLKRAPGVTVTGKTLRMRGLGAGYTQILVNGDRPPPGFSLDALAPDQIERIEIVRAASAEYSMQAIAGTINIVLRKVVSKQQRDLRMSAFRSDESRNLNAGGTWGDRKGKLSYFLNGSLYAGNSEYVSRNDERFTLPDGALAQARQSLYDGAGSYRGIVLFPRLSWKLENGDELNLSAGLQAARATWSGDQFTTNLAGKFPDPDYLEDLQSSPTSQRMRRIEGNWVAKLAGGKLDVTTSAEQSRNATGSLNDQYTAGRALRLLRDWDTVTRAHRYNLRAKYTRSLGEGHSLAAGAESSVQQSEEVRDRHEQFGNIPATHLVETFAPKITRMAGYVQDEWTVDKQLSVYLGARWEGVRTDSEASGLPDTSSRNHVLSPVAQALYKLPGGNGRQLRLALTRTYKAPTIEQLTARRYDAPVNTRFNADASGNPALKPELANGIDLGYEHFAANGATFTASATRRAISDYIRARLDQDPDGRWIYHPLNDGDALVHSVEAELKLPGKVLAEAMAGVDMRASVTRNWSKVSSVPGPDNRLDGQTPLSANLGVDWRKGDLSLGASLAYQQGGWVRVSEAQTQRQQTRRDLDTYALWKFNPRYQLRLSMANILGQNTTSDRLYRDEAGTSRETSFQPQSMRVGLNLEMKL
jgi:outer membrane receptor for ferrienterochelin and colicins